MGTREFEQTDAGPRAGTDVQCPNLMRGGYSQMTLGLVPKTGIFRRTGYDLALSVYKLSENKHFRACFGIVFAPAQRWHRHLTVKCKD
jgi:hypothetical protein